MKQLTLLLLILTISATGCQALVLDAEADLVKAETAQTETQSDADTIAALLVANQTAIEALQTELEAGRVDRRQAEIVYLELLAEQSELLEILAGQNKPRVSTGAIVSLVILLGIGGAVLYRHTRRGGIVIMMLSADEQWAALQAGEQWLMKVPQGVEREAVER